MESLDRKVSKYLDGNGVRVDGKPRASGIMDTASSFTSYLIFISEDLHYQIRAAIAHGIKVPPEFEDAEIVDTIERAVIHEWFAGCMSR